MFTSQFFVVLSIVVLAIVALLAFFIGEGRRQKRLTPLAGLAFGFILAGLFFGSNRLIGYSLLGIGVALAVMDMANKSKNR